MTLSGTRRQAPATDGRNIAPPRSQWRFWLLILAVTTTAVGVLTWSSIGLSTWKPPTAFWMIAVFVVLGELRPLFTARSLDGNGVVTSTAFVFAVLLQWGLGAAVVLQCVGTVLADLGSGKAVWRRIFNSAQYVLSWGAADLALAAFGRDVSPTAPDPLAGTDLGIVLLAAAAYFIVNDLLVSGVLALKTGTTLRRHFFDEFGFQLLTAGGLLALSPLMVLAAERSWMLVPLIIVPLAAVHQNAKVSVEQQYLALHDALTGLPNRKLLSQRATAATSEPGRDVALLLLDLDRFKEVNDSLGHHAGDQVLQEMAGRLADVVRPGDTVARLGGDEFAVLLPDIANQTTALDVAEAIRTALARPFVLTEGADEVVLDLDASVGVALFPDHAGSFDVLLQRADVAMYVAKTSGTGCAVYSAETDRHSAARLNLVGELRSLLQGDSSLGALELHYQPQTEICSGQVVGVEALVRWRHPRRGLVPPEEFIGAAERSTTMLPLTRWVLDSALRQLRAWEEEGINLRASINVSVCDLQTDGFTAYLAERLRTLGVPAGRIQLEITERALMSDPERVLETLRSLDDLGVAVSLDDFGTGHSSLARLRRLPVRELKIDRSFISRMAVDEDDAAIVRSIIELGHALGLRVIAEGVETEAIWHRLATLGCDEAQGWWVGWPQPAADVSAWLRTRLSRPSLASRAEATPSVSVS